ncbi:MAG TPA: VacB/RNase II family 3'-5' exoribonuclease [Oligoflexia bacterium]|mgnify:CR=1 FL=1|nr:VacB/RNase II family 3'-5' exoribonuclease [Oligoflexia bacterium]
MLFQFEREGYLTVSKRDTYIALKNPENSSSKASKKSKRTYKKHPLDKPISKHMAHATVKPLEDQLIGSLSNQRNNTFIFFPLKKRQALRLHLSQRVELPKKINSDDIYHIDIEKKVVKGRPFFIAQKINLLGSIHDPATDHKIIMAENKLSPFFSEKIHDELDLLDQSIKVSKQRKDFRDLNFVTIDGADAKDFDDAVCFDGKYLYVAIADVAHYVHANSALDKEAAFRGNSFYFPNMVIPMLPELLSNMLCSLRPKEDKYAMVLKIKFNVDNRVDHFDLYEGIIQSKERLTYDQVDDYFDAPNTAVPFAHAETGKMLTALKTLTQHMRALRFEEGSIDFDLKDHVIHVDKNFAPTHIAEKKQTLARQLIEECMLCSNVCMAHYLEKLSQDVTQDMAVYRVHPQPEAIKVEDLIHLLQTYNYKLPRDFGISNPHEFNAFLSSLDDSPLSEVFKSWALRAMSQAFYSVNNSGHYGLGFSHYLHFTSPIRRYSDLLVHRIIKNHLHNKDTAHVFPQKFNTLENVCVHISAQERVAQKAERDMYQRKSARFLYDKVGKVYKAYVVGMNSRGLFMKFEQVPIEGFLAIKDFKKGFFDFFEKEMMFQNRRNGHKIKLGDTYRVKLAKINLKGAFIDLILA